MTNKRLVSWAVVVLGGLLSHSGTSLLAADDPLPSWKDGATKSAITAFVARVTKDGSPDFVKPADRVAVFDNDGTLWPEQPLVQLQFTLLKLKALSDFDTTLKEKQPYKAALEGDVAFFQNPTYGEKALMEVLAKTHANIPQSQFDGEVRLFFERARHPTLGRPYTDCAYQPMVELLTYLRAQGFSTWICSGGGQDFVSGVSNRMYGVPPERVIGSTLKKDQIEKYGKQVTWRYPEITSINDKAGKVVNIQKRIAKVPAFVAGNVRSGGDIAMLDYSHTRPGPSFQLLVNHDDKDREFAYQEKDNASLDAAKKGGWTVVSMKGDWKQVFAAPTTVAPASVAQPAGQKDAAK